MATYNGELYIKAQLESLLMQTHKDWRLLIHDDNSTDGTVSIIREYVRQYPGIIIYIDDDLSYGTASGNFSFLLQQANADYIMFCDQDEVWKKDKIEKTLLLMKSSEKKFHDTPLLVHTDLEVVDENLNILCPSYWKYQYIDPQKDALNRLLMQNIVTACTVMINKKLAGIVKNIPDEAIMHDWWLALAASAMGGIIVLSESTILYRQHDNNDTGAARFNLNYIINKASTVLFQREDIQYMRKRTLQAKAFIYKYNDYLTNEQKELLDIFSKLTEVSWLEKSITILKHHFFQIGFIRNTRLFLPY